MPATLLVYGDSNAWGWVPAPERRPLQRHPAGLIWPERLAARLRGRAVVRVDAVPARTTSHDDPVSAENFPPLRPDDFNGRTHLPAALVKAAPVDMVILALGTNDLKTRFGRAPEGIAGALLALADQVTAGAPASAYPPPDVLLLAPAPLGALAPWTAEAFAGRHEAAAALGPAVIAAAAAAGRAAVDAGAVLGGAADGVDGVHLTEAAHAALADGIAAALAPWLDAPRSAPPV